MADKRFGYPISPNQKHGSVVKTNTLIRIANYVKNHWKAMLFSVLYVFGFLVTVVYSFNTYFNHIHGSFNVLLLLTTAALSLLALVARVIITLVFKNDAIEVVKKASIIIIPIVVVIVIVVIVSIFTDVRIPYDNSSELGRILSLFVIPGYFMLLALLGGFFLFAAFISFALLRLAINHTKIILIIFFASTALCIYSSNIISYLPIPINNSKTLESIARPSWNTDESMTSGWYFFHDDRIYTFDAPHTFISYNLKGNNKKIIADSEDLTYARNWLLHGNEAYYYTARGVYGDGIKKINIVSGEITTVTQGEYLYFIPDTLKDGKVLATHYNNYSAQAHAYFARVDFATGALSEEKVLKLGTNQPYYYSQSTGKVYFIDDDIDDTETKCIYEWNDGWNTRVYKYSANGNVNDFVFAQDEYIFAIIANKVIKFNMSDYAIIEERELDEKYSMISSTNEIKITVMGRAELPVNTSALANPIFYADSNDSNDYIRKIVRFDSNTLTFKEIIPKEAQTSTGHYVQKHGDYLVLQSNTETVIYNEKSNISKSFNSTHYNVENGYIYLMTMYGDRKSVV